MLDHRRCISTVLEADNTSNGVRVKPRGTTAPQHSQTCQLPCNKEPCCSSACSLHKARDTRPGVTGTEPNLNGGWNRR
eukprot:1013694-Pelagomonas_calceolata.AAC.2